MSWKNHIIIINVTSEDFDTIQHLINQRVKKNISRRTHVKQASWIKPELYVLSTHNNIVSIKLNFGDYTAICKMIDALETKRKRERVSPCVVNKQRFTRAPKLDIVQFGSIPDCHLCHEPFPQK